MKHLLNDLSSEEKNRIREQYEGGMTVDVSKFKKLVETKLGDAKPLVMEQSIGLAGVKSNSVKDVVTSLQRDPKKDPTKAQNCSDLDGITTDQIHSKVKSEKFNSGKGKVGFTSTTGVPGEKNYKQEVLYNEDPYSYVGLHNGKYCTKHESKQNWTEVTDPKQIESVKNEISKKDIR